MNWKEYTEEIKRTAPFLDTGFLDQLHMSIGMSTETGEILDTFKKSFAYGNDLDLVNIKEELGDCFWYAFNLMRMLGINFEEVLQLSVDKLRARYKKGWSKEEANHRNLNKEREILEGKSQLELVDDFDPRIDLYPKEKEWQK